MVLDGDAHRSIARFRDLPRSFGAGDLLVLNETRVIAARLCRPARRRRLAPSCCCCIPPAALQYDPARMRWIALARPARRLRVGERIAFGDLGEATVRAELDDGMREIELRLARSVRGVSRAGRTHAACRRTFTTIRAEAQERYQTVFARVPGSVAAPTASLHFTPELLRRDRARGVEIVRLIARRRARNVSARHRRIDRRSRDARRSLCDREPGGDGDRTRPRGRAAASSRAERPSSARSRATYANIGRIVRRASTRPISSSRRAFASASSTR